MCRRSWSTSLKKKADQRPKNRKNGQPNWKENERERERERERSTATTVRVLLQHLIFSQLFAFETETA